MTNAPELPTVAKSQTRLQLVKDGGIGNTQMAWDPDLDLEAG